MAQLRSENEEHFDSASRQGAAPAAASAAPDTLVWTRSIVSAGGGAREAGILLDRLDYLEALLRDSKLMLEEAALGQRETAQKVRRMAQGRIRLMPYTQPDPKNDVKGVVIKDVISDVRSAFGRLWRGGQAKPGS